MDANTQTEHARDGAGAGARFRSRRTLSIAAGVVYLAATAALFASGHLLISRDFVFLWVLVGLLILSLNNVRRWLRGLIFDWLPFIGILFVYDLLRNFADSFGFRVHYALQIKVDEALFGKPIPTVWLQRHYYHPPAAMLHDYVAWVVYLTHFFATLIVAAYLWRYAYPRFRQWRTLVLGLCVTGFVTYVLYPAEPPWLAGTRGHIQHVEQIVPELFRHTHVSAIDSLVENHFANKVAAVPSLHAAFPMMMLLFFWSSGWWTRAFFALYTLAMGTALVYTAEHFVSDVLLGWLYAIGVFFAISWWLRRRDGLKAERAADELAVERPPPERAAAREPEPVSYSVGPGSPGGPARS
jgi:hypothetical protein